MEKHINMWMYTTLLPPLIFSLPKKEWLADTKLINIIKETNISGKWTCYLGFEKKALEPDLWKADPGQ